MESRARASPEQFSAILEFMESHGDISWPQQGPQGRIKADRLWHELVQSLNSMGGGVVKPLDKWKKVWADWKTKTKKKALTMRREASGTGGGPSSRLTLTPLEDRVLGIMGLTAVVGQPGIDERGFDVSSVFGLCLFQNLIFKCNLQQKSLNKIIQINNTPKSAISSCQDYSTK
ncbi:uncharacterized protein LOC113491998 isoform X3 [Trichoplusia ni]|nr:uncharacterized protein LOC113491998 isoform X3 [Trichoplusia ni]